jgi:hypothetical protein
VGPKTGLGDMERRKDYNETQLNLKIIFDQAYKL